MTKKKKILLILLIIIAIITVIFIIKNNKHKTIDGENDILEEIQVNTENISDERIQELKIVKTTEFDNINAIVKNTTSETLNSKDVVLVCLDKEGNEVTRITTNLPESAPGENAKLDISLLKDSGVDVNAITDYRIEDLPEE